MDRLRIERMETGDHGTFGVLNVGPTRFFTGELPWRNNKPNESCFPPGIYQVKMTYSNRFKKEMYLVYPTSPREGIRIHAANFMGDSSLGYKKQLNGCISLGEKIGFMDGQKAILLSAPAVRRFESMMNKRDFILEVLNVYR